MRRNGCTTRTGAAIDIIDSRLFKSALELLNTLFVTSMAESHALDAFIFGDLFELFDILLDNAVHALCLIERFEHAAFVERHHRFDVE